MQRFMRIVTRRRRVHAGEDGGFTLIETVVALGLLMVVMLSTAGFFVSSLKESSGQTQAQEAALLANQQLEYTRSVAAGSLLTGRTQAAVQTAITNKGVTDLGNDDLTNGNYDPDATSTSSQVVPITMTQKVDGASYTITTFIDRCYVVYGTTTTGGCVRNQPSPSNGWMYRITANVAWSLGGGRACVSGKCQFVASTLRDPGSDPCFNVRTDLVGCSKDQPTIASFSPNTVSTGSVTDITVTGSNFQNGATVGIDSGGSISNVTRISSSTITFRLTAFTSADAVGTRTIIITNPDGTKALGTIAITTSDIKVTGVSPSSVGSGSTSSMTINGSGFLTGASISISSAAGTVNGNPSVSANAITFNFTAGSTSSAVGNWTITVINPDGGTATTSFNVTRSTPSISSVTPSSFIYATNLNFILNGSGFVNGATVKLDGNAVTSSYGSSSQLSVVLATNPAIGTHTFTVTNPDGGSATGTFSVVSNAMTVTGVSPSSMTYKSTRTFTISGTNFPTSGITVKLDGSTTLISTVTRNSASQLTVALQGDPSVGSHTFSVSSGTGSGTASFSVTNSAPSITNVGPDWHRYTYYNVQFTISGTNFVPGTGTVRLSGDINLTTTATINSNGTATFYYAPWLYPGKYTQTVTLTNPDGTVSNAYNWTLSVTWS